MIKRIPKKIVKLGLQYDVEPLIDITSETHLLIPLSSTEAMKSQQNRITPQKD